jgi:hypothetical protein
MGKHVLSGVDFHILWVRLVSSSLHFIHGMFTSHIVQTQEKPLR